MLNRIYPVWILLAALGLAAQADDKPLHPPAHLSPAERGLWFLLNRSYTEATSDISSREFADLWQVWPEPLRSEAEKATPDERRRMAFSRYGLIELPDRELPMGFTLNSGGSWSINCLACHGGKVAGQAILGLPNSHFAFQTWAQEVVEYRVKIEHEKRSKYAPSLAVPLGRSIGTTNAQIFSVGLTSLRNSDLDLRLGDRSMRVPKLLHHDLDAPPFWNVKKKKMLYIDGYVMKSHRVIMQFVLLPTNSGKEVRSWDEDFKDILAFAESVPAPKYRWPIDTSLADRGRLVFNERCASCHGTYGPGGNYPEKTVSIDDIGTDRRRWSGIPIEHRQFFQKGWVGEDGKVRVVEHPEGYVAPPLDGVWASAPYFHNGSVPTLWHLLHPDLRPSVWKRNEDGYDTQRVGLEVETFETIPESVQSPDEARTYYDTKLLGKSAAGHDFPNELDEEQRRQVLEYLKSL